MRRRLGGIGRRLGNMKQRLGDMRGDMRRRLGGMGRRLGDMKQGLDDLRRRLGTWHGKETKTSSMNGSLIPSTLCVD